MAEETEANYRVVSCVSLTALPYKPSPNCHLVQCDTCGGGAWAHSYQERLVRGYTDKPFIYDCNMCVHDALNHKPDTN